MSETKMSEYSSWASMKSRCYNRNDSGWVNYGGRGIIVCDEWKASFKAFLRDMGRRPSKNFTLERIDNDGPYAPGNVRWAMMLEQSYNKRGVPQFNEFYRCWACIPNALWAEFSVKALGNGMPEGRALVEAIRMWCESHDFHQPNTDPKQAA